MENRHRQVEEDRGPGVPAATAMALSVLGRSVPLGDLTRLWLFPPLVRGRREQGLIGVETVAGTPGRSRLLTVRYHAEETGSGLRFEPHLQEEGEVPSDRLPGIMAGVVRRSGLELGEPVEERLDGDPAAFRTLESRLDRSRSEAEMNRNLSPDPA